MLWYIGVTFLGAVGSVIIFLCALKGGLFEYIEEVKYQMFHEDEQCPSSETRGHVQRR